MSILKKITLLMCFFAIAASSFAQDKTTGMADTMRSNGRIYVVVAVMVTILLGLILYVIRVDRKITKLEKESK